MGLSAKINLSTSAVRVSPFAAIMAVACLVAAGDKRMRVNLPPAATSFASASAARCVADRASGFFWRGMSALASHDDVDLAGQAVGIKMLEKQHDNRLVGGARLAQNDAVRGRDGDEVGHDGVSIWCDQNVGQCAYAVKREMQDNAISAPQSGEAE